jgi:hypothetical protein
MLTTPFTGPLHIHHPSVTAQLKPLVIIRCVYMTASSSLHVCRTQIRKTIIIKHESDRKVADVSVASMKKNGLLVRRWCQTWMGGKVEGTNQ